MHLENEVEELEQKIADLEHQKQASESLNLMLKNKIENLEKENLKYQDQLKGLTQDLTEKLEDREREIGALSQFKKANQVLTQNITKLSEENEDLKDKISYLQNEKIRLKDELSEQKNISMKEMKKMDNTIERLIQQKRRLEEQVNILKDKAGKYNKEQIKEIFQENQVLAKAIKERDQSYNSLLEDYKNLIEEKEREMKEKNKYDLEIEKRIKQLEKENKKLRKKIKENSIKEEI